MYGILKGMFKLCSLSFTVVCFWGSSWQKSALVGSSLDAKQALSEMRPGGRLSRIVAGTLSARIPWVTKTRSKRTDGRYWLDFWRTRRRYDRVNASVVSSKMTPLYNYTANNRYHPITCRSHLQIEVRHLPYMQIYMYIYSRLLQLW